MKIAVHLHIFYEDMCQEFLNKLENLQEGSFDLFVTLSKENKDIVSLIQKSYPQAPIWVTENRGYDVGPFIDFLHHIDLDEYDYVLKLHTKNNKRQQITNLNGRQITRQKWYELLVDSLLLDEKRVMSNLNALQTDKKLGMIASKYLIVSVKKYSVQNVLNGFKLNMKKCFGESLFPIKNYQFVAGTMFLIRASLLKPIQKHFTLFSFEPTDPMKRDGTLAHVLERVFGASVIHQGYKIKGFDDSFSLFLNKILSLFIKKKITKKGYLTIKFFKLPIYRKKVLN